MQKEWCFVKSTRAKDADRDHGECREPKIKTILGSRTGPPRTPPDAEGPAEPQEKPQTAF